MTPMQAYRVLDRLIERDEVQRIETLSAYVPSNGEPKSFMICRDCGAVDGFALSSIMGALDYLCRVRAFSDWRPSVELSGLCRPCAKAAAPSEEAVRQNMAGLLMWFVSAAALMGDLAVEFA